MYRRILAAFLAVVAVSSAPLLARDQSGCTEAQLSVLLDVAGTHREDMPVVTGSLGYYLTDWVQAGIRVNYESTKDSLWGESAAVYGLGGYVECDWKRWKDCPVTPYIALDATVLSEDKNDNVYVLTVAPGMKAFLTETIGLSLQVDFDFATEEIYDVKVISRNPYRTNGKDTSVSCTAGLRFLFF